MTLMPLVNEAVYEGATVVTECGAGIAVWIETVGGAAGLTKIN